MPSDYRAALANFSYPYDLVKDDKIVMSREQASNEVRLLQNKAIKLKDINELNRKKRLDQLEQQLEAAQQTMASQPKVEPLSVISDFTATATTVLGGNAVSTDLRNVGKSAGSAVPRVFISYSHESDRHKGLVVDLAQRLRGDGIDCRIDQFEQSPSQGFPRWMQQQIEQSDFVLLVCTAVYKRRFDGLEELGKGLGVNFEGHLILQELYNASPEDIPTVLRGSIWYQMLSEYGTLYRRITYQPEVTPRPLGSLRTY
jgi:hypothetical protein